MSQENSTPTHINGKFAPGNKLSVGVNNPQAAHIAELKRMFLSKFTDEDMQLFRDKHIELLKSDDHKIALKAMELLHNHVFGKPRETHDLTIEAHSTSDARVYSDEQLKQVIAILDQPAISLQELPEPEALTVPVLPSMPRVEDKFIQCEGFVICETQVVTD